MTSQLREEIAKVLQDHHNTEKSKTNTHPYYDCPSCLDQIMSLLQKAELEATSKVDRFEVIDDTGRAYVKGSIYGSPVKVELSYQDDGKTLKVFVKELKQQKGLR